MKKITLLIFFLGSAFFVQAQSHLFVKAGTAYSNTFIPNSPFDNSKFRIGPQVGILYFYQFEKGFNLRTELLYTSKGRRSSNGYISDVRLRLNYLNLPVMAGYQIKKFTFELGPELGYMMSASQQIDGQYESVSVFFDKFELGAVVGVSYLLLDNLAVNLRYARGLTSIADVFLLNDGINGTLSNLYNQSVQLTVALKVF